MVASLGTVAVAAVQVRLRGCSQHLAQPLTAVPKGWAQKEGFQTSCCRYFKGLNVIQRSHVANLVSVLWHEKP